MNLIALTGSWTDFQTYQSDTRRIIYLKIYVRSDQYTTATELFTIPIEVHHPHSPRSANCGRHSRENSKKKIRGQLTMLISFDSNDTCRNYRDETTRQEAVSVNIEIQRTEFAESQKRKSDKDDVIGIRHITTAFIK